ncbi:AraC family transcriptional regulator [Paenibacillus silviterrae]|uniref:AraC family transcriptional regulator n=1 Tax=Paenibacillus silviterrae TaxID=3242194 RepID=UPI002542A7B8|nr:AraC family transcriptional regulator [Paenibacillus chinjuensis]
MESLVKIPNMTHTLQVSGCHFGIKPPGWDYPRHHHHMFELLCCLKGEVVQEINRNTLTLKSGDWLLLNSGVRHRTANVSAFHYEYFNVHFDLDDPEIRSLLGTAPYHQISGNQAELAKLNFYVSELGNLVRKDSPEESCVREQIPLLEEKLLLQSYILLIIHGVLSLIRKPHPENQHAADVSLFAADVAHAIEEKLSHSLCEETSIAGIARELNLSRSQCTKMFSKVYGLSPRQYVSRQKLKLAKELLVTSNLPMNAIAERLGFQSASHFSRQFKRWTGQSPTQYKPKHHSTL